jgi:ABC-2 type transport system ATP-binding protein
MEFLTGLLLYAKQRVLRRPFFMLAVDVKGLTKKFKIQRNREGLSGAFKDLFFREYREVLAVDHIDLQIPQGEICGYIGENGAGKSTTIKMLTGILVPTSGDLHVNGYVPYRQREEYVRGIGVVFGQRSQLWWDIGVIESFRLLKKVYRVDETDFRNRLNELVETLEISEILNQPVRKLSLGQRMRCELAAALLHSPEVIFLDEPTIGLDIVVKTKIREFLKEMNQRNGTTILLTTHDLQDIEALCTRVVMLDEGKIIYDGGLRQLKEKWGKGKEIRFRFGQAVNLADLKQVTASLGVEWILENPYEAHVHVTGGTVGVSEVIGQVVQKVVIEDIQIIETQTDDIVREIYQTGTTHV